jgi:hypothetical protein
MAAIHNMHMAKNSRQRVNAKAPISAEAFAENKAPTAQHPEARAASSSGASIKNLQFSSD